MSKKRNTKPVRVDGNFEKRMRDIMSDRLQKKLARFDLREIGMPEATRLALRCPSWPKVEEELRTLPKRVKR